METQTKTLVIDRSKWYRGLGASESRLVRQSDHMMCCLGFYLLQRGFAQDELLDIGTPEEVEAVERLEAEALPKVRGLVEPYEDESGVYETRTCGELITVNDDDSLDEPAREEQIAKLFGRIGVRVEFIN